MTLYPASARAAWLALALSALACSLSALACSDARQPPQPASFDRPTDVDFVCVVDNQISNIDACAGEDADVALHALVTQSARGEVAAVNLRTDRILDNRRDVPGYTFVPTGELPIAIVVSRKHPELTYVASYGSRDLRVMRTAVLLGLSSDTAEAQTISFTMDAAGGVFGGTPTDMVLLADDDGTERALLVTLSDVGKVARLPLDGAGLVVENEVTFIELAATIPAAPVPVAAEDGYALLCGGYERPALPSIPEPQASPAGTAPRPVALSIDRSCEDCGEGRVLVADEALPVLHALDLAALIAGSDPVLAPIATGAPTRDVVVTPRVPAAFTPVVHAANGDRVAEGVAAAEAADEAPSTYFVYAIDAVDGSVMVLENDALLALNRDPSGRIDRLPLADRGGEPAPLALSLEVITPDFQDNGDPAQYVKYPSDKAAPSGVAPRRRDVCLDDAHLKITPRRLRGVFLTAALADGTVRVVDVHDMDLLNCRDCANSDVPTAVLVRHHPRLATDPIAEVDSDRERDALRPKVDATYTVNTGFFSLRNNGSVASPLAPGLECGPCAEGMVLALPDPKDQERVEEEAQDDAGADTADAGAGEVVETICQEALVCGLSDPWAASPTAYVFAYEAPIPNVLSGDGRFVQPNEAGNVSGALELHSATAFCARGVLGSDDIGDARNDALCTADYDDDAALAGDEVVFISEPLSDAALASLGREARERELCASIRTKLDEDDTAFLTLEILAAFEDRLAVRTTLGEPFNEGELNLTWEALRTCLGDGVLAFNVRSKNSFTVTTSTEGFSHNVIANAQGRCVVDAMTGAERSRRSWTGCTYKDERVQLTFKPFTSSEALTEPGDGFGVTLTVAAQTTAVPLLLNAGQLGFGITTLVPARLRYSDTDQQLYLVDTFQGGLIPIDLDPFRDTPITSFY